VKVFFNLNSLYNYKPSNRNEGKFTTPAEYWQDALCEQLTVIYYC